MMDGTLSQARTFCLNSMVYVIDGSHDSFLSPSIPKCPLTLFCACVAQGDVSSKPVRVDRSPAPRRGEPGATAAAGNGGGGSSGISDPQPTAVASASATAAAVAATGIRADGRSGFEEDFGPVGGPRHLTKLVLKFTTASESDVQPSYEVLDCFIFFCHCCSSSASLSLC